MRDEIVYSAQKRDFIPGLRYANPRHFSGPATGVNSVIVVGDWPEVVDAYRFRTDGVAVAVVETAEELAALLARRNSGGDVQAKAQFTLRADGCDASTVDLPDDPVNTAWPKLRSIASQVSDTPVRNRPEAEAAIAAERKRRAEA